MRMRIFIASLALFTVSVAGALELDVSPAEADDWGYRPDGATLDQTPPAFVWRPCKGAASYILQVASDQTFAACVYERRDISWNAHCPATTLPAGAYWWRYAACDAAGNQTAWSSPRPFTVAEGARAAAQMTRAELEARVPGAHPRLFFQAADVARLRALAAGELANIWSVIQKQADAVLAKLPDTSEPPKYPADVKRKESPGEWKKIWWGNRDRVCKVADGAATLAFAYQISGDERYGHAARELVMAMTQWDPAGATAYEYNDEAAMPALYYTARAYDWAWPLFDDSQRAAVARMMRARGEQAYRHLVKSQHLWRPFQSHNNRAWHFLGEVALCWHGEIPEAAEWLDYAMTVYHTVYPAWSDSDGGWHEGIAYWNSYTERFMYWVFMMKSAFGINAFERPFYARAGYFPLYTLPPGTQGGAFGDMAPGASSARVARLAAVLANGARNGHWKWYAQQCGFAFGDGGYMDFIYAANGAALEPEAPSALPSSACFHGAGLAVFNTSLLDGRDNIQVHFKSSPFGRQSHGYNSNNAFLLNVCGERALISSGNRDLHGSAHHTKWMWETKSDNAILVNGEGQLVHSAAARGAIRAFDTGPAVDVVSGEAGGAYAGLSRWTRRMVFVKPDVLVIHDVLEAPEPASFAWLLHAKDSLAIDGQSFTWERDGKKVITELVEPAGLTVTHTDQFETPPGDFGNLDWREIHVRAETVNKARRQEFLALIRMPGASALQVHAARDAVGVLTVQIPEKNTRLVFEEQAFSVDAPDFGRRFADGPNTEGTK